MPIFSQKSLGKLKSCHPDLQVLFLEVVKYWDCTVLEGYRNQADQNAAYAKGMSKLRYPHGKHNQSPSLAVDVAPYPLPSWSNSGDFYYFGGFVMGIANKLWSDGKMIHKIKYGADWNSNQRISDESFVDAVHFEIME